jgi:hypothetical protein
MYLISAMYEKVITDEITQHAQKENRWLKDVEQCFVISPLFPRKRTRNPLVKARNRLVDFVSQILEPVS